MSGQGIWIEGERELYANMQKSLFQVTEAGRKGLRKAGMNILADAKQNLRGNHSVVTGQLRASGRVQAVADDKDAIDVGFFSQDSQFGYAYFVEYGRRAGKMPPVDYIMEWLRKKSSAFRSASRWAKKFKISSVDMDKMLRSNAFALAKTIAKKGTRPHPFFAPAVEKNRADIENAIGSAVKEEL